MTTDRHRIERILDRLVGFLALLVFCAALFAAGYAEKKREAIEVQVVVE